jgi:hypothetical protein
VQRDDGISVVIAAWSLLSPAIQTQILENIKLDLRRDKAIDDISLRTTEAQLAYESHSTDDGLAVSGHSSTPGPRCGPQSKIDKHIRALEAELAELRRRRDGR